MNGGKTDHGRGMVTSSSTMGGMRHDGNPPMMPEHGGRYQPQQQSQQPPSHQQQKSSSDDPYSYNHEQQQQQQQQQERLPRGPAAATAAVASIPATETLQQQQQPPALPQSQQPTRNWWDMTRTIWHYERIEQVGEGTYGQVYKARCRDTGQIVALKKIRVHHGGYWGLPPTVLREIKILKRLTHPNLVRMVEVVSSKGAEYLDKDDAVEEKHRVVDTRRNKFTESREKWKGNLFLVLEYVEHDLTGLMDVAYRFTEVQTKSIFKQLLEALQYMHDNKYIHRDIKSSNILIDHNFRVKLADFGLARSIEPPILDKINDRTSQQDFTNKVITLWYRPPELLMGETRYGPEVDIWSAGCILAELILGKPLFTGKTDMEQLQLIFDLLGTPSTKTWPNFRNLKLIRTGQVKIDKAKRNKLRERYQHKITSPALNLIEKLLELDPQKRLTAQRALTSRYFLTEPRAPDRPEDMGEVLVEGGQFHEFQTKKKRREAKLVAEKARQTALIGGQTEAMAQEHFDATYREIMEKVAREGLDAGPVDDEAKEEVAIKEQDDEKRLEPSKSDNKRRKDDDDDRGTRKSEGHKKSSRGSDKETKEKPSSRDKRDSKRRSKDDDEGADDRRSGRRHRDGSTSRDDDKLRDRGTDRSRPPREKGMDDEGYRGRDRDRGEKDGSRKGDSGKERSSSSKRRRSETEDRRRSESVDRHKRKRKDSIERKERDARKNGDSKGILEGEASQRKSSDARDSSLLPDSKLGKTEESNIVTEPVEGLTKPIGDPSESKAETRKKERNRDDDDPDYQRARKRRHDSSRERGKHRDEWDGRRRSDDGEKRRRHSRERNDKREQEPSKRSERRD